MHIGIIGAGNIGGTIARKLAAAGHIIKLAGSKGPEAIGEQAKAIGAVPTAATEATKAVDVIILAIPFAAIPDVADVFTDVPPHVVIIDTSNYYPFRDGHIAEVDGGKPESVWSSEQLGRPVIKAFNAVLAHTLAESGAAEGATGRIAIPVAGDDAHAKRVAQALVNETGFDAFDAGELAGSWRQQPGTPAYCTELTLVDLADALAAADRVRAPQNRDRIMEALGKSGSPPSHEEIVALNRAGTVRR